MIATIFFDTHCGALFAGAMIISTLTPSYNNPDIKKKDVS